MAKMQIKHFLVPPTTELSPFLCDDNQLLICNGVNPSYKKGLLIKDLGYSQIGSTIQNTKPIRSLFNFRQSGSIQKMLATVDDATGDDTQLFYSTGGAWTEIPAAETAWANEATMDVEMEQFISYCFFVGYSSTDGFLSVGSLINTTFSTTTNITNMPQAKYIKKYRNRLYVANCYIGSTAYPYRVYYSSVPSAGSISWTPASDLIDVGYGEEITGLGENWDRLIIFTEFSAYLYNQSEKKKVWDTGCGNNRTIKNSGAYMIFANKDNVWASTGGRPQAIGNAILELIRHSTVANWRAEVIDEEYIFYLGSTVANGISYSNCVATLNITTGMWRWRELYEAMSSLAKYTVGGDDFLYLGCSDGEVMKKSKYTDTTPVFSDDGNPIVSHWRTKAYDMGDPSISKKISKVVAYAEYAQGLQLRYRIFDKNQEILMPFKEIGTLKKVINIFDDLDLRHNFLQLEGIEYSKNKAWRFYGLTVDFFKDKEK